MIGYHNNPAANEISFDSEGYFKTGDIFYRDGSTKLWYIADRKKVSLRCSILAPLTSKHRQGENANGRRQDLIKVRGFQVAPPELENILLDHPGIDDAAVVGVSVPSVGTELPRAFVVRRRVPGEPESQSNVTE